MKPEHILMVRHGESEGNANKDIYKTVPDYALYLTKKGKHQAIEAGWNIRKILGHADIKFYVSPFFRTKQTLQGILKAFPEITTPDVYFDARLREQEWNGQMPVDGYRTKDEEDRDAYGHFYWRFQGGESCADMIDRTSLALDTWHRDFEKPNFPRAVVMVGHGKQVRVMIMRFFHLEVEEFELLANPKNCDVIVLELDKVTGKYKLITPLRKYDQVSHPWQFDPKKFDEGLD